LLFLLCSRGEKRDDTSVEKCAGDAESGDKMSWLNGKYSR
jgi:hypothetical protein